MPNLFISLVGLKKICKNILLPLKGVTFLVQAVNTLYVNHQNKMWLLRWIKVKAVQVHHTLV